MIEGRKCLKMFAGQAKVQADSLIYNIFFVRHKLLAMTLTVLVQKTQLVLTIADYNFFLLIYENLIRKVTLDDCFHTKKNCIHVAYNNSSNFLSYYILHRLY